MQINLNRANFWNAFAPNFSRSPLLTRTQTIDEWPSRLLPLLIPTEKVKHRQQATRTSHTFTIVNKWLYIYIQINKHKYTILYRQIMHTHWKRVVLTECFTLHFGGNRYWSTTSILTSVIFDEKCIYWNYCKYSNNNYKRIKKCHDKKIKWSKITIAVRNISSNYYINIVK